MRFEAVQPQRGMVLAQVPATATASLARNLKPGRGGLRAFWHRRAGQAWFRIGFALMVLALPVPALMVLALPAQAEIAIQQVTSPGGIKAWLVEEHGIPFTALEIRFLGGTSLDGPGKRGAVNLMTALIEEGAGDLDSQGFATARDALAAEYSFSSDQDGVGVSAKFLTENRDQAVDLLHLALTRPRFDADAVARVRGQVLSGLASDAKDPDAIGGSLLRQRAYGMHPYGTVGDGTVDSVTALSRDDIVTAFRQSVARDRE